uniref:Uncharacterized protein n=1 Tax=Pipistrellus kuhlii TaxID=59472 RepID=A0A7J7UA43_PIPKU|nr:hypothetical protein mPipKuh1_009145 [Pipistrellus kuhlii]
MLLFFLVYWLIFLNYSHFNIQSIYEFLIVMIICNYLFFLTLFLLQISTILLKNIYFADFKLINCASLCVSVFQLSFGTVIISLCELMPLEVCHVPEVVSTTCCNLFSYTCWALIPPMDVTHSLAPALDYDSGLLPPHGDQPDLLMIIKFGEIKECN